MDKTGIVFINDKNIFTTYGAELIGSSFANLICCPDRKEDTENNMISHPGVQVFNDNIQPTDMEVELTFVIYGNSLEDYLQKYKALIDAIDNDDEGGNFKIRVTPLKTIFTLRRKSYLPLDTINPNSGKLIVTARELNPKDRIKL